MKETIKRNILTALLREESIKTTLAKAKIIRRLADNVITLAKNGNLASIRRVSALGVKDKDIIKKLFSDIKNRFADRNGGYTRIIQLGFRKGDCAPVVLLELTEKKIFKKSKEEKKKEKEKKEKSKIKK